MHTDPDYSAAYVVLETDAEDRLEGYGITFTLGKGTEVDTMTTTGDISGPLSKLLVDMDLRMLLYCIDFRYITDVLTGGSLRRANADTWLPCPHYIMRLAGVPRRRTEAALHRGAEGRLDQMKNANQCWDVPEAVEWMPKLAEFKPLWTEEPTSPDDILRHTTISKCHNRVIFKQLLQVKALQFLHIDSCRLGSVNENLSVLLMAKKFEIPVCPHAGGVGLCELVQHLIIFDFISVSASLKNRICEYVDHLYEHFEYPVIIKNASYMPLQDVGYSTEMKEESVKKHQYPDGEVWKKFLAAQGN